MLIESIVFSLIAGGVGLLVLYSGVQSLRANRAYLSANFLNGKKVPTGEAVKVKGTVKETKDSVVGPVTGNEKAFLWYHVEYHRNDDNGSDWHPLESGIEGGPVVLETDSGDIVVDPIDDTNVYFSDDNKHITRIDHQRLIRDDPEVSEPMQDFLERNDLTTDDGGLLNHSKNDYRRYTEESIEVGDTMVAFGKTEPVTSDDYEGDAWGGPDAKIASGPEDGTMIVVDQEDIPFWDRVGPYLAVLGGAIFILFGVAILASAVLP